MTWQVASLALLALALAIGFGWYERRRPPARIVGVVAVMAALAVVGRLAFAALPNVKPTTDIVLFAGYALGAAPGFAVGAIGALASNFFLGQGPWTAWQMAAWGGVGIGGALLARVTRGRELSRVALAAACFAAGLAFGAFMDLYQWTLAARQDLATYLTIAGTSLPYNLAHAVGNVVFCLLIGPLFVRSLRRYRRRFEVRWPAPAESAPAAARAAVTAAVVALAAGTAAAVPATAAAASPVARAVDYLERAQNRDGGFGAAPGQASSELVSGWSALGLAAAGVDPEHVRRRDGKGLLSYLRRSSRRLLDVGELQRTMLVLRAAGRSPRRFAGRDQLATLRRAQREDGSWKGNVAFTAFGLFALRAAGEGKDSARMRRAARYLGRAQAPDGGWGVVPGLESDVDDTGAVLQALCAAGRCGIPAVQEGVGYLRAAQVGDGGWGQLAGRDSNAQSTAWAVQGLVAARAPLGSLSADPLAYLRGLQRRDGHIAYSQTSDQTPTWVTAQAVAALRRKPFPLAPARAGPPRATVVAERPSPAPGAGDDGGVEPAALAVAGIAVMAGAAGALAWRRRGTG